MHDITMAVFGITGLLALATLLVPVASRANIAFSILLAVAGIMLGLAVGMLGETGLHGPVGDFLTTIARFDLSSEAFILLFLPALLFETAIAIDVRRLMDDIAPILLLAVVAVLVSTFVVGLALAGVADAGIVACLLLAAIVSTTDPIAVVAIFRDLGVPHRLSLLVEGESLFNDAAAISLFALFLGMLSGEREASALEGAMVFLYGFAGGLGAGYVCGQAVCRGLSLVRSQRLAVITVTLAAAYLTFVLAEHYLRVSGVVAVVTAALVISYNGRTRVPADTWSSLVDVWQQVGYWASSLIFLLATMRVPDMLKGMGTQDFVLLAVLVGAAMAARALVLFGLFPALTAIGWSEPIAPSLRAVIVWGGLRGAISLALALAVVENPKVPAEVKSFVSVLCTGFVLVTLLVNAPLLRPLIRLLGLDRLSPADMALRGHALASALSAVRKKISGAAHGYGVDPSLADELTKEYTKRLATAESSLEAHQELTPDEKIKNGLSMLAEREETIYMRHYRDGVVTGNITRTLQAATARIQDGVKTAGLEGYLAAHRASIAFPVVFRLALHLQRRLGIEALLAQQIANRFEVLLMLQAAVRELVDFCGVSLPAMCGTDATEQVKAALKQRQDDIETGLAALRLQYSDFSRTLQSQYLERAALRIEELEYRRLRSEAVIGHEVFNNLMSDLRQRTSRLSRAPAIDLRLDPVSLVGRVPLFADLATKELATIARLLRPVLTLPGELIVRKGDVGDAMYFIASGAVEVDLKPNSVRLGTGDFFGEMALVTGAKRTADIRGLGYCQLLTLRASDFHELLDSMSEVRDCIHLTAQSRLVTNAERG